MANATIEDRRIAGPIRLEIRNEKDKLLSNREIGLPKMQTHTACWKWEDAPIELRDLCCGHERDPQFLTVVPNEMRWTHMPEFAQVIVACASVFVAAE